MSAPWSHEFYVETLRKKYGDEFDLTKVEYLGCFSKVILICKSHGEFSRIAHYVANKWAECPACKLEKKRKEKIDWLLQQVKSFRHFGEFTKSSIYSNCARYGLLPQIREFLPLNPDAYKTKRVIYAFEFSNKSVYVGLTCRPEVRYQEHTTKEKTAVGRFIKSHPEVTFEYKVISVPLSPKEASILEQETLEDYLKKGWIALNKMSPGGLGKVKHWWTKEKCKVFADLCYSREELHRKYPRAYSSIQRNLWYDLYDHMPLYSVKSRVKPVVDMNTGIAYESVKRASECLSIKAGSIAYLARERKESWKYLEDMTLEEKKMISKVDEGGNTSVHTFVIEGGVGRYNGKVYHA